MMQEGQNLAAVGVFPRKAQRSLFFVKDETTETSLARGCANPNPDTDCVNACKRESPHISIN